MASSIIYKKGTKVCLRDDPYMVLTVIGVILNVETGESVGHVCEVHCEECEETHVLNIMNDRIEEVL